MSVRIQEDRQCDEVACDPVIVESFLQRGVKAAKPGIIPYRMPFDGTPGVPYVISAVLNIGWCKYGDNWIRPGDYHTETFPSFAGPNEGEVIDVEAPLVGYQLAEKPEKQNSGSKLTKPLQKNLYKLHTSCNDLFLVGTFLTSTEATFLT